MEKHPLLFWDTELKGYAFKVTTTRKAFFTQTRINQKLRRVTLGAYGALTTTQAREIVKDELFKHSGSFGHGGIIPDPNTGTWQTMNPYLQRTRFLFYLNKTCGERLSPGTGKLLWKR